MAEYGSMFLVSGLASILFFGGWHGPIPIPTMLASLGFGPDPTSWPFLVGYLVNLLGCVNFIMKGVVGVTVMMWARWTLPRLRIDQVMTTCLKYCVPLAAFCFLGALGWAILGLPTGAALTGFHRATVREHWVVEADRERVTYPVSTTDDTVSVEQPSEKPVSHDPAEATTVVRSQDVAQREAT